jgi:hypothetical protein
MKTRLSILLLLGLAAACDGSGTAGGEAAVQGEPIPCAVGGASSMADECRMERLAAPEGKTLILRHPNGGFRRLLITADGRGVVAADGADPAVVSVIGGNRIEVSIAGDRYQLPAALKAAP